MGNTNSSNIKFAKTKQVLEILSAWYIIIHHPWKFKSLVWECDKRNVNITAHIHTHTHTHTLSLSLSLPRQKWVKLHAPPYRIICNIWEAKSGQASDIILERSAISGHTYAKKHHVEGCYKVYKYIFTVRKATLGTCRSKPILVSNILNLHSNDFWTYTHVEHSLKTRVTIHFFFP